jgi:hypothetical protein
MREYMMQFCTKDGCFKSAPITMWGRLAKDRPGVGAFYILFHAKQADYLGLPRFSVGDNGAVAKLDLGTPQIRYLKRFFVTDDDDGELELPEGLLTLNPHLNHQPDNTFVNHHHSQRALQL